MRATIGRRSPILTELSKSTIGIIAVAISPMKPAGMNLYFREFIVDDATEDIRRDAQNLFSRETDSTASARLNSQPE